MGTLLLPGSAVLGGASELTYPEFGSAVLGGTVQGQVLRSAGAAVGGAILADAALVLGAGLAGFQIGQYIMSKIEPSFQMPIFKQPFYGGQCYALYNDNGTWSQGNQSGYFDGGNGFGKRSNFRLVPSSGSPYIVDVYVDAQASPTAPVITRYLANIGYFDIHVVPTVNYTPTYLGNGAGACGNVPADFKTMPVNLQPLVFPSTVDIPDGQPIPINPQVLPSTRNDPNLEPNRVTSPGVLVNIPEAGQMINFTPSGVQIIPVQQSRQTTGLSQRTILTTSLPPVVTGECPCPEVDTEEILCRIKRLEKDLLDDGYDYARHPSGSAQGARITGLPDELVLVELAVTQQITNAKRQRGVGGSPDVLYAGWFSFILSDGSVTREPVDYAAKTYVAPPGADGYSYTVYDGFSATTVAVTRKRKDYVDNC